MYDIIFLKKFSKSCNLFEDLATYRVKVAETEEIWRTIKSLSFIGNAPKKP